MEAKIDRFMEGLEVYLQSAEGEPVAHRSRTVMTKVILHFNEDLEWLRVMLTSDRLEDTKNIMCENPPFTFCGFRSSACWSVRRSREY